MSHSSERYHEYGGNRPTAEQREAVKEHLKTQWERQNAIDKAGAENARAAGIKDDESIAQRALRLARHERQMRLS